MLSEFLEWAATSSNADVQLAVAAHPNTKTEVLEKLAGDRARDVRIAVAKNPRTPP